MKKKSMMLGGLLAAVVVTAYSVSGTYAKYISAIDLTDEARVAKWNLTLNGEKVETKQTIDLFGESYSKEVNGNKVTYVQTLTEGEKVVAPGTTGSYTMTLGGTMETRFNLNVNLDTKNDFVVYYMVKEVDGKTELLKSTKADDAIFGGTTPEEYHPLTYTITKENGNDTSIPVKNMTLAEVKEALAKYNSSNEYEPGTWSKEYTLTWTWNFENNVNGLNRSQVDALDTFAGENLSSTDDKVTFNVTVTATQVGSDGSTADAKVGA